MASPSELHSNKAARPAAYVAIASLAVLSESAAEPARGAHLIDGLNITASEKCGAAVIVAGSLCQLHAE